MNKRKKRLNANVNNNLSNKRTKHYLNGKEKPLPSLSDLERMYDESDSESNGDNFPNKDTINDEIKKNSLEIQKGIIRQDKKLNNILLPLNRITDDVIIIDDEIPHQSVTCDENISVVSEIPQKSSKIDDIVKNQSNPCDDNITIVSETPSKHTNDQSNTNDDCVIIVSEILPSGTNMKYNSVKKDTNTSSIDDQSNTSDDCITLVSEILPNGTNMEQNSVNKNTITSRSDDCITIVSDIPPNISNIEMNLFNNDTNISRNDNENQNQINTCNDSISIVSEIQDTDTSGSESTIIYEVNTSPRSFSPLPSTSRDNVTISENDKIFNNSLCDKTNSPSKKIILVEDEELVDSNLLTWITKTKSAEIHYNCNYDYSSDFNEENLNCIIIADSSIEDIIAENASLLSKYRSDQNLHNIIEVPPNQNESTRTNTPNTDNSANIINNTPKSTIKKKKLKKKHAASKSPKGNSNLCRSFQCPICLDEITSSNSASTICGHIFCMDCIKCATEKSKKCPTCRKTLKKGGYHRLFL